jgi:hypothetical protein
MVGRTKLQNLRAWSTKDREQGGVKPPSPDEHVSEKKLSLSRKLRASLSKPCIVFDVTYYHALAGGTFVLLA